MKHKFSTWEDLSVFIEKSYGIEPELFSVLFLIGVQESGTGLKKHTWEEKTDLIKLAQFILLQREGFYLKASDNSGNDIWIRNNKKDLPADKVLEKLLMSLILDYFDDTKSKISENV